MFALELAGVSKRYGMRVALDGIELGVAPGTALGLLGPNGAGKTTALRLLLGFATPSAGAVRLQGFEPSDPASRRGVGYLPERLRLPGRMRVRAFLRLQGRLCGLEGSELERQVSEISELTGIDDRLDERLGELSKGLAQRAGFAQALLGSPNLLLLDEPNSGLDPIGMRAARDWIERARERGFSECFIAGGEEIYREGIEVADRIYMTRVDAEPEGDTRFPEIDEANWQCVDRQLHLPDERHAHGFAFETWDRVD